MKIRALITFHVPFAPQFEKDEIRVVEDGFASELISRGMVEEVVEAKKKAVKNNEEKL